MEKRRGFCLVLLKLTSLLALLSAVNRTPKQNFQAKKKLMFLAKNGALSQSDFANYKDESEASILLFIMSNKSKLRVKLGSDPGSKPGSSQDLSRYPSQNPSQDPIRVKW